MIIIILLPIAFFFANGDFIQFVFVDNRNEARKQIWLIVFL